MKKNLSLCSNSVISLLVEIKTSTVSGKKKELIRATVPVPDPFKIGVSYEEFKIEKGSICLHYLEIRRG